MYYFIIKPIDPWNVKVAEIAFAIFSFATICIAVFAFGCLIKDSKKKDSKK